MVHSECSFESDECGTHCSFKVSIGRSLMKIWPVMMFRYLYSAIVHFPCMDNRWPMTWPVCVVLLRMCGDHFAVQARIRPVPRTIPPMAATPIAPSVGNHIEAVLVTTPMATRPRVNTVLLMEGFFCLP